MSDLEVLQKSFMDSMDSMQKQFQKEKESLEKKILELKEKNKNLKKERENDNEMFKQNLKSNSDEIIRLQNINRDLTKQLENNNNNNNNNNNKLNEEQIKKYEEEINKLKELKPLNDQLNIKIKELDNNINKEKEEKIRIIKEKENLEKKLELKDKEINELNQRIKKYEQNNKELLEKIEKFKEEKEKWKMEKESIKQYQKAEEKRLKELELKKIEEGKMLEMSIEKKNKFLGDILCDFLLKLNNSPYFLTIFDLLNNSLKNFEDLNYFAKMSLKYNLPINDISFIFFSNLRSYILLRKENSSLKNFLTQKSFKYSEIDKDDIETIKMIRTIKLSDNNNLLDLYKKKKEHFFQKVELTFDLLKNKIIASDEEDKKENNNKYILAEIPEILNITDPPINLEINFDKINLNKLSSFISFQINNIFTKLEKLEIEVSKINLDIFYSIVFNCINLKSISIKLNNKNLENNIVILNNIIPILFANNKSLQELNYYNIPLMNKYLPNIVTSFKASKLEKLTLSGSFTSKADLAIFNSYFSSNNLLTKVDFSFNNFNIPSLLSTTLLNYNVNKKLTEINFSHSELNDDDINIIVKYCEENNLLKICDISDNDISQKSCFKLGSLIEKNSSLEKLNLSNCKLNGENIIFIFNSKGSKGLKHIILNNNEIGDLGLVGISGFIKNSPNLEILELINVEGNDMGFTTLINVVKNCEKLKKIFFGKNKLSKISIEMVKKFGEELKSKGIIFYLDKIEGDKSGENIDGVEFV